MKEHEASRTLVKSPPELWSECSDAASLSRHLDQFGEITITRLEPETAVAWEGEIARGTVRLEPSGWGTRVILTVRAANGSASEPPRPPEPEPEPDDGRSRPRETIFGRMRGLFRRAPAREVAGTEVAPELAPELATTDSAPEPPIAGPAEMQPSSEAPSDAVDPNAALVCALDSLGQAHHRPYSRA